MLRPRSRWVRVHRRKGDGHEPAGAGGRREGRLASTDRARRGRRPDPSGLAALVAGLKLARSRSGELRIVCEHQRSVRKVLEVTGLERVLERYDTVDEATAA